MVLVKDTAIKKVKNMEDATLFQLNKEINTLYPTILKLKETGEINNQYKMLFKKGIDSIYSFKSEINKIVQENGSKMNMDETNTRLADRQSNSITHENHQLKEDPGIPVQQLMAIDKLNSNLIKMHEAEAEHSKMMSALMEAMKKSDLSDVVERMDKTFDDYKERVIELKHDYDNIISDLKENQRFMEASANRLREESGNAISRTVLLQIAIVVGSGCSILAAVLSIVNLILG